MKDQLEVCCCNLVFSYSSACRLKLWRVETFCPNLEILILENKQNLSSEITVRALGEVA